MSLEVAPSDWMSLDPWWSAYTRTPSVARSSASVSVFDRGQLADRWDDLEPWWNVYTETGHETAVQLANLLDQSNDEWASSDAPFDTDPLAADLTRARYERGPLQPNVEVEWSRWLAQLLRPSASLVAELFDVPVEQAPREVLREDQLSKQDGSVRRPDILLCHAQHGISIEVKLDDENYQKTAETARLVERHYDEREWSHALLLPKGKRNRLASIVEPPLSSRQNGRLRVAWDDPGSIDVIHWRDVTAAIRSVLRRSTAVDDHWAANAYLFCAIAEQQLMGFQPQPVVERLADPTNVFDTLRPIDIADTLEEQLTYLRANVNQ